jgi:hypothetical protein
MSCRTDNSDTGTPEHCVPLYLSPASLPVPNAGMSPQHNMDIPEAVFLFFS